MRYAPDHKEKTRRRIVETSARAFRRDGLAATGLNAIMGEAGLTPGSFYAHFGSRDELAGEALAVAFSETRRLIASRSAAANETGRPTFACIIDGYLSPLHLDNPEASCAVAALGAEFARQAEPVRRTARNGVEELIEAIQAEMPGHNRARASAVLALMSGTIQIARTATVRSEALAFLEAGRIAAYELCEIPSGQATPASDVPSKPARSRTRAASASRSS